MTTPLPSDVEASVLNVLVTALPASELAAAATNQALWEAELEASLSAGKTPEWYQALPSDVKSLLPEVLTPSTTTDASSVENTFVPSSAISTISSRGGTTTTTPTTTSTPSPFVSGTSFGRSTSTATLSQSPNHASGSGSLSSGAKVGIGVGIPAIALIIGAGVGAYILGKRRGRRKIRNGLSNNSHDVKKEVATSQAAATRNQDRPNASPSQHHRAQTETWTNADLPEWQGSAALNRK